MSRFTLQPMPRSTSVQVLHTDFPGRVVALVRPNGAGVSLIPVETDHPPSPLTGTTMRYPHLGAVADLLGVAWARAAA